MTLERTRERTLDDVDGFDDVFGSAISKAVRRAVDGVGRNPLASLDAPGSGSATPTTPTAPTEPAVEPGPPPLPRAGITDPYELLGISRRAPWPDDHCRLQATGAGLAPRRCRRRRARGGANELIRDLNAAYAELRIRRGK